MAMSGKRIRDVERVTDVDKSWLWLRLGDLKREIEGAVMAA